jgi:hypothetical protein
LKNTSAFLLVIALAACASAGDPASAGPAAPAELDPVGSYSFSTTVQGMAVDGRLRITGSRGAWGGSLYSDVTGELPLSSVSVEGQTLRLTADTPDGTAYIRMQFSGETFTGEWTLGGDGGALSGRRVSR